MQKAQDKVAEYGVPMTHDDLDYIEHRVYHDYVGTCLLYTSDAADE